MIGRVECDDEGNPVLWIPADDRPLRDTGKNPVPRPRVPASSFGSAIQA